MRENSLHLSNFVYRDNSCYRDNINRAAGRRAVVMVFASLLRQFYHDRTTPARLPGLHHLDNFIWTRKLASVNRDFAKTHANPDTDGNSPYHRAVIKNTLQRSVHSASRTANNKMHHDKTLFSVYQFIPRHTNTQPNTSAIPRIKNWHSHHNTF